MFFCTHTRECCKGLWRDLHSSGVFKVEYEHHCKQQLLFCKRRVEKPMVFGPIRTGWFPAPKQVTAMTLEILFTDLLILVDSRRTRDVCCLTRKGSDLFNCREASKYDIASTQTYVRIQTTTVHGSFKQDMIRYEVSEVRAADSQT